MEQCPARGKNHGKDQPLWSCLEVGFPGLPAPGVWEGRGPWRLTVWLLSLHFSAGILFKPSAWPGRCCLLLGQLTLALLVSSLSKRMQWRGRPRRLAGQTLVRLPPGSAWGRVGGVPGSEAGLLHRGPGRTSLASGLLRSGTPSSCPFLLAQIRWSWASIRGFIPLVLMFRRGTFTYSFDLGISQ